MKHNVEAASRRFPQSHNKQQTAPSSNNVEAASRRFPEPPNAQNPNTILKRQDAASTFPIFNPYEEVHITQANLPHWRQDLATYFVTFRLVDSLPKAKLDQWLEERELWQKHHPEPLSDSEKSEYYDKFSATLERWLDLSSGSCILAIPDCKAIVLDALHHLDDQRYTLGKHVIASNHIHALVTPIEDNQLSNILHSWKSFTAKSIAKVEAASRRLTPFWESLKPRQNPNKIPTHPVWQKESYDHIIRTSRALRRIEEYICNHREYTEV